MPMPLLLLCVLWCVCVTRVYSVCVKVGVQKKLHERHIFIQSDGSHASESNARSRCGGLHHLGDRPGGTDTRINGPILVVSTLIDCVAASAAETEYASLFINSREGEAIRTALEELGHPQDATPIQCDNSCATGIANDTVKQRRSRAMDVRFHWIRDRVRQGHFNVFWKKGVDNLADFFTKVHPVKHFLTMRKFFIHDIAPPATNKDKHKNIGGATSRTTSVPATGRTTTVV